MHPFFASDVLLPSPFLELFYILVLPILVVSFPCFQSCIYIQCCTHGAWKLWTRFISVTISSCVISWVIQRFLREPRCLSQSSAMISFLSGSEYSWATTLVVEFVKSANQRSFMTYHPRLIWYSKLIWMRKDFVARYQKFTAALVRSNVRLVPVAP